jgi:hypothetical protein
LFFVNSTLVESFFRCGEGGLVTGAVTTKCEECRSEVHIVIIPILSMTLLLGADARARPDPRERGEPPAEVPHVPAVQVD